MVLWEELEYCGETHLNSNLGHAGNLDNFLIASKPQFPHLQSGDSNMLLTSCYKGVYKCVPQNQAHSHASSLTCLKPIFRTSVK